MNLNGKQILLDGTDNLLPTGVLPERCLNGSGLVISKQVPTVGLLLHPPVKSLSYYNVDLTLNDRSELKGQIKWINLDTMPIQEGRKLLAKGKDEYVKDFIGGRSWQVDKSAFTNDKETLVAI